jgi:hypothetical protein
VAEEQSEDAGSSRPSPPWKAGGLGRRRHSVARRRRHSGRPAKVRGRGVAGDAREESVGRRIERTVRAQGSASGLGPELERPDRPSCAWPPTPCEVVGLLSEVGWITRSGIGLRPRREVERDLEVDRARVLHRRVRCEAERPRAERHRGDAKVWQLQGQEAPLRCEGERGPAQGDTTSNVITGERAILDKRRVQGHIAWYKPVAHEQPALVDLRR